MTKKSKSYTVRTGDTLSSLAKRFGIPDTQLAQANQGVGIQPGNVVTIPDASMYSLPKPQQYFGGRGVPTFTPDTPPIPPHVAGAIGQAHGRGQPVFKRMYGDWINPILAIGQNWGTPFRAGMGEVQKFGYSPSIKPANPAASGFNAIVNKPITAADLPTSPAVSGNVVSGNYQEKLPYGNSYNYAVNTGEIPIPGASAAVKYGESYEFSLGKAMENGYGYDYGNYLQWAEDNNIQQPASYYEWKSTQGVTRSGQSSQFWEYMQGLSIGRGGGLNLREKLEQRGQMKNIKKYNKKWREARGLEPYAGEEEQPGYTAQSAYQGNSGRYYSAPASMGLVTWRT